MASNEKEITKIESNVTPAEEIVWNRKSTNPLIASAIINDDLSAQFKYNDKTYDVRSPNRKIIRKFRQLRRYRNKDVNDISDEEFDTIEDVQEAIIKDMMPDLDFENDVRSEYEFDLLSIACWEYYSFLKRKSRGSSDGLALRNKV